MTTRDDIARTIRAAWAIDFDEQQEDFVLADALMPLVRRAQAEALREATRIFAEGEWAGAWLIDAVDDDVSAVQSTDRWFNEYADRIEKEGAGA